MARPVQILLEPEVERQAIDRANAQGLSLDEYLRSLVARDLGPRGSHFQDSPDLASADQEPKPNRPPVSLLFNLGDSGACDVARDKDRLIGEAMEREFHAETTRA